jgi:hypothetical protein
VEISNEGWDEFFVKESYLGDNYTTWR